MNKWQEQVEELPPAPQKTSWVHEKTTSAPARIEERPAEEGFRHSFEAQCGWVLTYRGLTFRWGRRQNVEGAAVGCCCWTPLWRGLGFDLDVWGVGGW